MILIFETNDMHIYIFLIRDSFRSFAGLDGNFFSENIEEFRIL